MALTDCCLDASRLRAPRQTSEFLQHSQHVWMECLDQLTSILDAAAVADPHSGWSDEHAQKLVVHALDALLSCCKLVERVLGSSLCGQFRDGRYHHMMGSLALLDLDWLEEPARNAMRVLELAAELNFCGPYESGHTLLLSVKHHIQSVVTKYMGASRETPTAGAALAPGSPAPPAPSSRPRRRRGPAAAATANQLSQEELQQREVQAQAAAEALLRCVGRLDEPSHDCARPYAELISACQGRRAVAGSGTAIHRMLYV